MKITTKIVAFIATIQALLRAIWTGISRSERVQLDMVISGEPAPWGTSLWLRWHDNSEAAIDRMSQRALARVAWDVGYGPFRTQAIYRISDARELERLAEHYPDIASRTDALTKLHYLANDKARALRLKEAL